MWQTEPSEDHVFGYEDGIDEFSYFLSTLDYTMCVDPNRSPISLMGALHLWLNFGEGFLICPTYESFMRATVLIIDDWLEHDCIRVGLSPVWPHADGVRVRLFETDQPWVQVHPRLLLQKEVYLQLKAKIKNREREELVAMLQEHGTHKESDPNPED